MIIYITIMNNSGETQKSRSVCGSDTTVTSNMNEYQYQSIITIIISIIQ